MKNARIFAAIGAVGLLVLLAVTGAALAAGTGSASNSANEQTSNANAMNGDSTGHMYRMQNQQSNMASGQSQGQDCQNQATGVCDGAPDRLMTQDKLRKCTCLGAGTCSNISVV